MAVNVADLVEGLHSGSVKALARLISLVEIEQPEAIDALKKLYSETGKAYVIGITGPPGSGKSTLANRLTEELRKRDYSVGIIAIDPSSPFSGGALLGDRLRMQSISMDEHVYFRSMATRGTTGGLAKSTSGAIILLDAFGKDYILLETVGVGQDELDIVKIADSTLLVSVPGLGDEIQALKAGIMEVGDIHIVNKADRDGADKLVSHLQLMCGFSSTEGAWNRPIIKTVAVKNQGIEEVLKQILAHREYLEKGDELQRRRDERIKREIMILIETEISGLIQVIIEEGHDFEQAVHDIALRRENPYTYAQRIIEDFVRYYGK